MVDMVTINATLVAVVIFMLLMSIRGFKKGFVKELSGLIALVAACFVVAIVILIISGIKDGKVSNSIYSFLVLFIFGLVYGLIRIILNAIKVISKLPILHFVDEILGFAGGFCEALILVWVLFMLCENNYLGPVSQYVRADLEESSLLQLVYGYCFFVK